MNKSILTLLVSLSVATGFAQNATDWAPYYSNDRLKVSIRYEDCHYPEKGIDNRYLFLKLENLTNETMAVGYDLNRSYNGKELDPDVKRFDLSLPANSSMEAQCAELTAGLHLFVKSLNVKGKSVLSHFELSDLVINGKNVVR